MLARMIRKYLNVADPVKIVFDVKNATKIEPNDRLILHFPELVNQANLDTILDQLSHHFGDVKFLVVTGPANVYVSPAGMWLRGEKFEHIVSERLGSP